MGEKRGFITIAFLDLISAANEGGSKALNTNPAFGAQSAINHLEKSETIKIVRVKWKNVAGRYKSSSKP